MQSSTTLTPNPDTHDATLAELTHLAMDIARTLHAEITAPAAAENQPDQTATLVTAFDRVARAVRRTVLLSRHLAQPRPEAPRAPGDTLAQARRTVLRTVEDRILRAETRPENPDALRRELLERLDHPEFDADLATRPVEAIITDIARDLGVQPFNDIGTPWPRRTPADIARLHDQAERRAEPGTPATTPWTAAIPPGPPRKPLTPHAVIAALARQT